MNMTFNQWAQAPAHMNGHAERLLEACRMLATKFAKVGRSPELRDILQALGYSKVMEIGDNTAALKAFHRRVSALPKKSPRYE